MDRPARMSPDERVVKAEERALNAQEAVRRAKAERDYKLETDGIHFTKDFNAALEAIIEDRTLTAFQRFMAWVKRYSWGYDSLFAIEWSGYPKTQADFVRETGISKQTTSKVVKFAQLRGYLEPHAKRLIPACAPALAAVPEDPTSKEWQVFVDGWRAANSTAWVEEQKAREVLKANNRARLAEFKQWRKPESATQVAAMPETPATPFEQNQQRHRAERGKLTRASDILVPPAAEPPQPDALDAGALSRMEAMRLLFSNVRWLQQQYPDTSFARPLVDYDEPTDQKLMGKVLENLGGKLIDPRKWPKGTRYVEEWGYWQDYLNGWRDWVRAEFLGLSRGDKQTPRPPGSDKGPQRVSMLPSLAHEYASRFFFVTRDQMRQYSAGA